MFSSVSPTFASTDEKVINSTDTSTDVIEIVVDGVEVSLYGGGYTDNIRIKGSKERSDFEKRFRTNYIKNEKTAKSDTSKTLAVETETKPNGDLVKYKWEQYGNSMAYAAIKEVVAGSVGGVAGAFVLVLNPLATYTAGATALAVTGATSWAFDQHTGWIETRLWRSYSTYYKTNVYELSFSDYPAKSRTNVRRVGIVSPLRVANGQYVNVNNGTEIWSY